MIEQFEAIGTHWELELPIAPDEAEGLIRRVRDRIEAFESTYSRFRASSLISKMAKEAGEYLLPEDARPLFDMYAKLYGISNGAITPLIGQTLVEAGYDASYSLTPKKLTEVPTWEEALEYHFPRLTLKQPAQLDLGGFGKGYLIDIVSELIEVDGISDYCVDAGGDMRIRGQERRIGLENPDALDEVIGVAQISKGSLCASAGSRRKWAGYSHILNPLTLQPVTGIKAVWVTAESTLVADALTTALYFCKPDDLPFSFEYALLAADATLHTSKGFSAEFFIS